MKRRRGRILAAAVLAAAGRAQQTPPPTPPPGPIEPPFTYELEDNLKWSLDEDDFRQTFAYGGFRFRWPALGIEIRGRNGLLLSDREAVREQIDGGRGGGEGPPRRGIEPPAPRRHLSLEELHGRVQRLLSALGSADRATQPLPAVAYDALRFLYFEGGVIVLRDGVVVARGERLWISPLDDRLVVEDCELRYATRASDGSERMLVIRGPRLEKQGRRWTGRDLTVTSCEAGEPHVAVASGELELIEREGQFEIRARGNTLQIGGTAVLPLPDAHFFSAEQSAVPVRGFTAGYSSREGARARLELGAPMQGVGGDVHTWLTGRPAHEFRGDWDLGLGWIELRGYPIDGAVSYRGQGLYEGRTEAFWLDDGGPNLREITNDLDGSPIDDRNRNLLRTQNRVFLGAGTQLDLTAFHAGDGAVYSEFFRGDYHDRELPETSVYLSHRADNVLVTLDGRFQTDSFAYKDNRGLAPFFVEELPVATVHWLAQPIATTPWDTPIVLDTATEVGQRRRAVSERAPGGFASERTLRADQLAELSAPFLLGPIQLRPFANARFTYYDAATDGDAADRAAFEAGVRAGTRLSRTWQWFDAAGEQHALRHVMSPLVTFANRFQVDGDPGEFRQFDELDALSEQNLVRLELRNQLQRMDGEGDAAAPRDLLFADVAQDFWPNSGRDNQGDQLGLFYYDLQVRPDASLWRLDTLAFGLYGDHDWEDGLRTFDTEVQFGKVLGLDWNLDYRRDAVVDAAAGIGAHAALLGRWDVTGNISYDFEREDILHYFVGLRRDDHDWSLMVGISYDPFEDVVSFRMEFEPRLFGRASARDRGWFGPMGGEGYSSLLQ